MSKMFSNKNLISMFIPLVVEQGLEYTVGIAASMMVAKIGESAVSGVSLVDFVMALIISMFAALATGGAVIAGQYLGRRDIKNAKIASDQLMKLSLIVSIIFMAVIYFCKPFILNVLFGDISESVKSAADVYFNIVVFSIPFLALYNSGAALFRSVGNTRLPMKIMIIMNVLNIAGNFFFINIMNTGVEGVAIPTLCSRGGAAIIIIYMAFKDKFELQIGNFILIKNDIGMIKRILRIGMPFGFENGMFHLGRLIVLSIVSMFGTAAIAANSVAGSIVMFEVLPGMAINLGLSVIISRCMGAGDIEQAQYYKKKIRLIIHGSFVLSVGIVLSLMPIIMKIYNFSSEAARLTWIIVIVHGIMTIFMWPSGYMLPIVFRSAGDARFPMVVSIVSMILSRLVFAYIFAVVLNFGMLGTWAAMFLDWTVKSVIFEYHDRKGKWMGFKAI